MTAVTAERQEETIASVRADLEQRHADAVEARRIQQKRNLLEEIVRQSRSVEPAFQAAKERKRALKEVRNDLKALDGDDLDIEDLQSLLHKVKSVLGTHDGGFVGVVVATGSAPAFPQAPRVKDRNDYARAC